MQEALLHAVVGADLLQNIPGELAIELVSNGAHGNGDNADDSGDGNEEGPAQQPHVPILLVGLESAPFQQPVDRLVDLVNLQDGVDEDGQVGDAEANDLNRVLEPQGVPCQQQDVEETEDEEGQECRYRAVLRFEAVADVSVALVLETELEPPKYVSVVSCQHPDGLSRSRTWP